MMKTFVTTFVTRLQRFGMLLVTVFVNRVFLFFTAIGGCYTIGSVHSSLSPHNVTFRATLIPCETIVSATELYSHCSQYILRML